MRKKRRSSLLASLVVRFNFRVGDKIVNPCSFHRSHFPIRNPIICVLFFIAIIFVGTDVHSISTDPPDFPELGTKPVSNSCLIANTQNVLVGCGLGFRWDESEGNWTGVWTRRGATNVFDALWTNKVDNRLPQYLR